MVELQKYREVAVQTQPTTDQHSQTLMLISKTWVFIKNTDFRSHHHNPVQQAYTGAGI